MYMKTFTAAILATCYLIGTADALTITNRDTENHKVTVSEDDGSDSKEYHMEPSARLDGLCLDGCTIRLNDSPEAYEYKANEIVSIEGRQLFRDKSPAQRSGPNTDATGRDDLKEGGATQ